LNKQPKTGFGKTTKTKKERGHKTKKICILVLRFFLCAITLFWPKMKKRLGPPGGSCTHSIDDIKQLGLSLLSGIG